MRLKRPTVLVLASVALFAAAISYYALTRPNPPSYRNSALAREVQPGTTRRQLVKLLGDPIRESDGWTLFHPSPTGYNIRAKFGSTGLVEAIDSGDGNVRDLRKR
jgi:hypothetical protein